MPWRRTPQAVAVLEKMHELGHATNRQLAKELRQQFPGISTTTVHRITNRLLETGYLQSAPSLAQVKMLDANIEAHDHFYCQACDKLVDVHLTDDAITQLEQQLPGTIIRQDITVSGVCEKCA